MTRHRRLRTSLTSLAAIAALPVALTLSACNPTGNTGNSTNAPIPAAASPTHPGATAGDSAVPTTQRAEAPQPSRPSTPSVAKPRPPHTPKPTAPAVKPAAQSATHSLGSQAVMNVLNTLPVKGRAPMTGYTRDAFGPAWADVDHNGCDTRNDILHRDLSAVTVKAGTHGCVVLSGTFLEPYSGRQVTFQRGPSTSTKVQIDHVVALADAWQTGAQQWPADKRLAYANDPLVLLAADGPLNGQKGAANAASWLPPNKSYRCTYVTRQVTIKATYGLWVTSAEKDAIARTLAGCPAATAPSTAPSDTTPSTPRPEAAPAAPPAPAIAPDSSNKSGGSAVFYPNCAAVRAAGAAPLHVGDPGYSRKLDRDGDGSACE